MQNPTDQAETSIPTVTVREGPHLNPMGTFTVRRKAAKRSESWYQKVAAPLTIPARKKQRREEPLPTTTTDEATTVAHPPTDAATDHADSDPVLDMHPIARTTAAPRRARLWTPEEDVTLISAVTNTRKKKRGKEYKTDWVAIARLVPGRTNMQCYKRWNNKLDPSIDCANGRTGLWEKDEDIKLKGAVQKHGRKNWAVIAALVPGRTRMQCQNRWHDALSIDQIVRTGKWAEDEDIKLKEAVQKHGGKNWDAVARLVPDRTRSQCKNRWHNVLDPSTDKANGRTGKWTADEASRLEGAVQMHGVKDWVAIAALVPGRTNKQCYKRWNKSTVL
jgi:hypothetical protein